MYLLNRVGADITPFLYSSKYRSGDHSNIAKLLKASDENAVNLAAKEMARLVPKNAVLIPIPSHYGDARDTLALAKAIGRLTHTRVVNALAGVPRESQYQSKKNGKKISVDDMGIYQKANIPEDRIPIFIDNVIASGTTASAAVRAVGRGVVLAYAYGDRSKPITGLKSAEPITFDENGEVIPLRKRFDTSNSNVLYSDRTIAEYDNEYMELAKDPKKNNARLR